MMMDRLQIACVLLTVTVCFEIVTCHPERPAIVDNGFVRRLFKKADKLVKEDDVLTKQEMGLMFDRFDLDKDGLVEKSDFMTAWQMLRLGDLEHASTLFRQADTDKDGTITKETDYERIFYYFDRSEDGVVTEPEFQVVWNAMSSK